MADSELAAATDDSSNPLLSAYSGVSAAEHAKMYRLKFVEGLDDRAIASLLGRSTETVWRHLRHYGESTVEHAKKLLEHTAHPAAEVLVKQLDSEDERIAQGAAAKVLQGAGVMGQAQVNVGVQVVLGTAETPASYDPFAQPQPTDK